MLARYGASVGKVFWAENGAYNVAMAKVEKLYKSNFIDFNYMYAFYKSPLYQLLVKNNSRSAQAGFNKNDLSELLLPIPPFEEQKRIVKKIQDFEPLIQQYEQREKLLSNLETSFEEKLKASILQYAIEGKLVKQDPNDEPASKLLERIKFEKEKLIQEGKIKRDKHESEIFVGDDKNYYENLSNRWIKTSLINCCILISRGKSPKYSSIKRVPIVAQKCNQRNGLFMNRCLFLDPDYLIKYSDEYRLKTDDILINSTGGGTVGRTGFVYGDQLSEFECVVWDSHVTVVRTSKELNSKYVFYFLISPIIQNGLEKRCEGSTNQIELYSKVIKSYQIPLPPLKEQNKIVNKIDKIFSSI